MKKLSIISLFFLNSLHAADITPPKELISKELSHLEQLIQATERSLSQQKKLYEQITHYQEIQRGFQENPEDNDRLYQMIKSAYTILESIKTLHLETAFEPEFLSELTILSKPAMKSGIPKP